MREGGDPNAFQQHGRLPEWSREVGDKLRLVWQLLLHAIHDRRFLQRCNPIPRSATDCDKFHAVHTCKFLRHISPQSWDELDVAGKKSRLTAYLFLKFSTDPGRRELLPPANKTQHRADICWNSFWLSQGELDEFTQNAVDAYVRGDPDIRPRVDGASLPNA